MAEFPLYTPQVRQTAEPSAAKMPEGIITPRYRGAEAANRAVTEVWGQVGKTGDLLMEIGDKIRQTILQDRRTDQFTKSGFQLLNGLYQARDTVQFGVDEDGKQFQTDFGNWEGNFKKKAQAVLHSALEQTPDPQVKMWLMQEYARHFPTLEGTVRHEARTQQIDMAKASAEEIANQARELAQKAKSPDEVSRILARAHVAIDNKVQSGIMHPEEGQKLNKALDYYIGADALTMEIQKDPHGAIARLDNWRENYSFLKDQEHANHFQAEARSHLSHLQHDIYSSKLTQVIGATADKPTAPMPSEGEIHELVATNRSPRNRERIC
jgi:hypothetical protein